MVQGRAGGKGAAVAVSRNAAGLARRVRAPPVHCNVAVCEHNVGGLAGLGTGARFARCACGTSAGEAPGTQARPLPQLCAQPARLPVPLQALMQDVEGLAAGGEPADTARQPGCLGSLSARGQGMSWHGLLRLGVGLAAFFVAVLIVRILPVAG